jgi:hypothetical protein
MGTIYEVALWITLLLLITIVILELWKPALIHEGFANLVSVGDSAFWIKWMPRRGDVGPNPTEEQPGYLRDLRYAAQYADVQRIGQDHDFCRMVQSESDPQDTFFACALAGTEGLSTVKYRTPSVKDGWELSRDDYMRDVLGEGRSSYCRILKTGPATFEAQCNPAGDESFSSSVVTDTSPPDDIQQLLRFYQGIMFWFRFRDDLLDYAKQISQVAQSGGIAIDETPRPPITRGLSFNGEDQFLRLGDTPDLSFGQTISLRSLRAISVWVYFDEFTNNAHVFDFGNGAGKDNVFLGILGRGDASVQQDTPLLTDGCGGALDTVPTKPSGAQCVEAVDPRVAMATSSANVNVWDCPDAELFGRVVPPLQPKSAPPQEARTATLLYEVWEGSMRKVHIKKSGVIPLRKWCHLVLTTTSNHPTSSGLHVYRDGEQIHSEENVYLPQQSYTTKNYIGKSNWTDVTGNDQNADELFKGSLFDFRGYESFMTSQKVKETYEWGRGLLGLPRSHSSLPTV